MQAVDFDLHAGENLDLGDDVVVKPSHYTQYKIEPVPYTISASSTSLVNLFSLYAFIKLLTQCRTRTRLCCSSYHT